MGMKEMNGIKAIGDAVGNVSVTHLYLHLFPIPFILFIPFIPIPRFTACITRHRA